MRGVLVLYEDSLVSGTRPTNYGPHVLVAQCVADLLAEAGELPVGATSRALIDAGLEANPQKGKDKLKKQVFSNLELLTRGGTRVVAVYDRDAIHELVDVDPRCFGEVVRALTPASGPTDLLATVLLDANLETVIETLQRCGLDDSLPWRKALEKRRGALLARDRILQNAAVASLEVRRKLCRQMPSFQHLICKLAAAVLAGRHG